MTITHPEQAGFLAAIVAQPEDDTVRGAYADWLDEHGQPERAEFIRVQCELTRTDMSIPGRIAHWPDFKRPQKVSVTDSLYRGDGEFACRRDCPACRLVRNQERESELLRKHGREWSRWACPNPGRHRKRYLCPTCGCGEGNLFHNRDPQFRRGFVHRVTVPTSAELVEDMGTDEYGYRDWQPTPLLAALAATTVEEVWVGDRRPENQVATATHSRACKGQPAWEWWDSAVPKPLFDWMWERYPDNRDQHPSYMRGNCLEFPSESEARSVLGRAHIAFGKGVRR